MKILSFICVVIPFLSFAQLKDSEVAKIDSIQKVIKQAKNDTLVVNALKEWDNIIYRTDPGLDLTINQRIDSISTRHLKKKIGSDERAFYLKSRGFATGNLGYIYNSKGDNSKALEYYNSSVQVKKELGDDKGVARAYNNIGSIYHEQGVHAKAIEYYTRALDILKKLDSQREWAGALNNIAIIYRYQGEYESALKYYKESLQIKQKEGDSVAIAIAYLNIGTLYNEWKQYDKAREYTLKCYSISEKAKNKRYIALAYVNLGAIYHSEEKLEDALEYYLKGYAIQEEIGDGKMLAETAGYIGKVYRDMNNLAKAQYYSEKALQLSYDNDVVSVTEQVSGDLYQIYKKRGKKDLALKMLELNIELRDSINSKDNQKAIIRQQFKYDYERQADSLRAVQEKRTALAAAEQQRKDEIAAKDAERKNIIIWSGAAGLVMVLIFTGFIIKRLRITRRQKSIIEVQKKKVDIAYQELGKEKQKSEDLLLNILPEEVAEELKERGEAEAKLMDDVTVLFTDFKGFTALSEILSAKELVKEINVCFSAFDHIMDKYNVEKIKTIGDAYMAAGGLPIQNETHASDVVMAALEIQEFMLQLAEEKKKKGLPFFEIRIGVHTGPVIAGIVGVKKFQYDIWGDTVNTASRMESSGEVGKVNISASTYALIKDKTEFKFESRGEIEAKGKGKLKMFFVQKV